MARESSQRVADFFIALRNFTDAAAAIWSSYQEVGPSRVDERLFDELKVAMPALSKTLDCQAAMGEVTGQLSIDSDEPAQVIRETIESTRDLAKRCACTPMGLCFVTGEAGLIPRPDQHDAFEAGLKQLRGWCEKTRREKKRRLKTSRESDDRGK